MFEFMRRKPAAKPEGPAAFPSGTGILAAVVVIVFFVFAARWLESLAFGLILAYFFLPLEKFFEEKFFPWKPVAAIDRFFRGIWFPVRRWRRRIAGLPAPSDSEIAAFEHTATVFKSTLLTFVSVFVALVLILGISFSLLLPWMVSAGKEFSRWAGEKISSLPMEQAAEPGVSAGQPEEKEKTVFTQLRKELRTYAEKNRDKLAGFALDRGRGILSWLFGVAEAIGVFAFDAMLTVFFFFYFLQKMAMFTGKSGSRSVSRWCVETMYGSPWLPRASEETMNAAAGILDHIFDMLGHWVRGYLTIILVESVVYVTLFTLSGVPYPLFFGLVAGQTVLLPFIGPIGSFVLTAGGTLALGGPQPLFTLIAVASSYLLVTGVIEQLFLYPVCVGNAIGLTTVESIIVVLLGGLAAGITGMIFALPVAAVLKYLIPNIYLLRRPAAAAVTPSSGTARPEAGAPSPRT